MTKQLIEAIDQRDKLTKALRDLAESAGEMLADGRLPPMADWHDPLDRARAALTSAASADGSPPPSPSEADRLQAIQERAAAPRTRTDTEEAK